MESEINFSQNKHLENSRVLLSSLKMDHFESLLPFSEKEPELWKYALQSAEGGKLLKKYIREALLSKNNKTAFPFVVFDKQKQQIAGMTRLYDYNKIHNTISIGHTWYGKYFQGTGLNKHCKFLLLSEVFDTWHLDRVEFRADYRNKRSINAMKSIGCIEEGILRSNCKGLDGRRDSIVLRILKNEWQNTIKDLLKYKPEFYWLLFTSIRKFRILEKVKNFKCFVFET